VIVVTRVGLGKVGKVADDLVSFSQDCQGLPPVSGIDRRFTAYQMKWTALNFLRRSRGTTISGITKKQLKETPFVVPPTAEQIRIADALDELFSDLDAGVTTLEQTREKLKLYRASVLNAGAEGTLTAGWREQNPQVKPSSELLKRILAERRRRWEEEQLRKFKEKGLLPPKDWNAKYKEPAAPNTHNVLPLPQKWCWASMEQISLAVTDGDHNPPKRVGDGVPHLTAMHVKNLKLTVEGCSYISMSDALRVFRRYHPESGDLIITCVGTVGRTAIVPDGFEFSPDRNLAAVRFSDVGPSAKYVQYFLEAPDTQAKLMSASGSTAQPHLYLGDLRSLLVALPPLSEQEAIIETVEDQLSVIDHLEADLDATVSSAQALRQAILRHAFAGKLVPQYPNEEPASELIRRISTERGQRAQDAASARGLNGRKPRQSMTRVANKAGKLATKEIVNGRIADR
jgi:type I restriction enzyme S subunit